MNFFKAESYRLLIEDYLLSLPKQGHGEFSKIAKILGINSTLVSQVMKGSRNFTYEQGFDLANYMGFNETEAEYFLLLLQRERAGTPRLRNHFQKRIDTLRNNSKDVSKSYEYERQLTETEASIFYSSWLYSAIRVYTSIGETGRTANEICEKFRISNAKTMDVIRFLLKTNLCIEKNNHYFANLNRTFGNQKSPHLIKHRANWRMKAIQKLEDLSEEEMSFTSVMSISKKDFDDVRFQIAALLKNLSKTIKETTPEELACLNIDFIWIEKA